MSDARGANKGHSRVPAGSFAQRFRRGDQLLGALVRMPNEGLVELAGIAGLDYIVIDAEHGPGDQLALAHHLNAAAATGLATIVRIGSAADALRVLDLGADGVLAPHVSSVEQARDVIAAVHYPPLGRRGFAAYTRAGRYGLRSALEHHQAARETLLITMIEDLPGLDKATVIAELAGVDGLMFGPADFACELGILGQPDDPRVRSAAESVRASARSAGKVPVSIVGSVAAAEQAFAAGDTAVMYNVQQLLGELFTALAAPVAGAIGHDPDVVRRQPLVLVPGMLGDETLWDAVAADLTNVAVPHFARIDHDDSVEEMATSVLATAPQRFALAGHSLGAIVALEVMRRAPERVTRLALVNATGRAPSPAQQSAWAALIARLDEDGFDEVVAELAHSTLAPSRRAEADLVATNLQMARHVGVAGLRRQLRAQQARTSYLDDVGKRATPILIVSCADDEICPPERQQELLQHCTNAHLVTLPGTGHMAPLEQPAALAAELRAWLAPA